MTLDHDHSTSVSIVYTLAHENSVTTGQDVMDELAQSGLDFEYFDENRPLPKGLFHRDWLRWPQIGGAPGLPDVATITMLLNWTAQAATRIAPAAAVVYFGGILTGAGMATWHAVESCLHRIRRHKSDDIRLANVTLECELRKEWVRIVVPQSAQQLQRSLGVLERSSVPGSTEIGAIWETTWNERAGLWEAHRMPGGVPFLLHQEP